ncbi:MAG: hypothetical protein GXY50_05135 [Syntrophomonadaceae bacterium]|nr:hypothetical protein [Syntrophomonadaceae bacterium]
MLTKVSLHHGSVIYPETVKRGDENGLKDLITSEGIKEAEEPETAENCDLLK